MYSQVLWAPTRTTVTRPDPTPELEPLDRERFEHLTEAEAVSLLASRSRFFVEHGWSWSDALLLAVEPGRRYPLRGMRRSGTRRTMER